MEITLTTKLGQIIHGRLTGPPGKRLIIICHGYKSNGRTNTVIALMRGLNKKGYATFAFDFPQGSEVDIRRQVLDIGDIIQNFNNYEEFILLASSLGALTAAIASMKMAQIVGLITLNGFFGYKELGDKYRKTFRNFRLLALFVPRYRAIWRYFKQELKPELITVRVLVIHSKTDTVVPISQSHKFYDALICQKDFRELINADHGLSSRRDINEVVNLVAQWL